MKKYCKALVNLGMAFIILLLIVFLVPKLLVFFAPFVAGWIIALIASPLVRFFEEKVKIKRKAGSAFVIVAVIALVILILYLVGAKLTDEIMGLIGALPVHIVTERKAGTQICWKSFGKWKKTITRCRKR